MTGIEMDRYLSRDDDSTDSLDVTLAPFDAQDAVTVLCRGVTDILERAPRLPTRLSVRLGRASIEVEWLDQTELAIPGQMAPVRTTAGERLEICAPLVGVYYVAPERGASPFVSVGDDVVPGQQVAIIEAMKLMNPILAEHHATVVEILVRDAEPVEYGQPLMVLTPRVPS